MASKNCEHYKGFDRFPINPRVFIAVRSISGMREFLAQEGRFDDDYLEVLDDSGQGPRVEIVGLCSVVNAISGRVAVVTSDCVEKFCGKEGESCPRKT
jgi:hypothetical protein